MTPLCQLFTATPKEGPDSRLEQIVTVLCKGT